MLENILEVLSLTQWKKKRDILKQLDFEISERSFRKLVEQNNKLFGQGKVDYYIAHSCRGYKKHLIGKKCKNQLLITEKEQSRC